MSDDFNDTWTAAQAKGDQHMALLRDQAEAVLTFTRAAQEFEAALIAAGMAPNARTTALVQIALAVGLTSG